MKTTNINISENLRFSTDFGEIVYDIYEPREIPNNPIIIQIAHGMIEHRGRYKWLANNLAGRGYIVAINDHRGHGDSINPQAGIYLGEMGEGGFNKATYDLYKLNNALRERFKGARIILLGHSMGSLLARRYLFLYAESIDALILSGSPAYNKHLEAGIRLGKIFRFFRLKTMGAKILNNILFSGFNKTFKAQKNPFAWLCSDDDVLEKYADDTKCRFIFSLQSIINLFCGMLEVYGEYPTPKKPNLPVLFISGGDDACGNFGVGVQQARIHLQSQGYKEVGIILYRNARHELFNERIKEQVVDDMTLWLEQQGL